LHISPVALPLKDHYKTLELSSQASAKEIKDAYRRMARLYHPDKNQGTSGATAWFQEIQEAYAVLSDPYRRSTYDKELRHAGQYQWQKKGQVFSTEQLLKQVSDLAKYINTLDGRSIHFDALTDYICALLSPENILLLQRAGDATLNTQISRHILHVCHSMVSPRLMTEITSRLAQINQQNPDMLRELEEALALRKEKERKNRLVPYATIGIVLLIVLIMCFLLLK